MGITRVKAARSGDVDYRIFKVYRNKQNMPDTMLKMSNHYDNLMTMPILFYLIVTMIYVTQNVDNTFTDVSFQNLNVSVRREIII